MKTQLLLLIIVISLVVPSMVFGIDFVWKDEKGGHYYECGGYVVGGRTRVKAEGGDMYRVKGSMMNRIIKATSIYHAAQIACGEKPEMDEQPTQSPGE